MHEIRGRIAKVKKPLFIDFFARPADRRRSRGCTVSGLYLTAPEAAAPRHFLYLRPRLAGQELIGRPDAGRATAVQQRGQKRAESVSTSWGRKCRETAIASDYSVVGRFGQDRRTTVRIPLGLFKTPYADCVFFARVSQRLPFGCRAAPKRSPLFKGFRGVAAGQSVHLPFCQAVAISTAYALDSTAH